MAKPKGKRNTDNGTPPEQSNRDGPTRVGTRRAVLGAGAVSGDTDAPGITRKQQVERPANRGRGARRPGTTRSGPAAMPSGAGVGAPADDTIGNEAASVGDADAPLSAPTGGTGAPKPGRASRAPEADAASAGPRAAKGQGREKKFRRQKGV